LKTPKADIHHEFIDTPGGLVYWVPRVSVSVLPVLGTVYDSLNKCIEVYRKYASEAGFGIRLSCQKRLKCGYMKQKYIVCNRKGCPKEAWLNTSDPKKNDRQYTLTTCYVEHNHELDRVEYKHLSKAERKLTYNEQLFIIKAANANISAVRAHNLYTGLKGSSSLADEVAKCNYKEFGDIVSFDATYKTNKYKMVFVPFMAIDNHRRSITVGSGLLKKETAKAYGWLLRAFKKAFVRPPNIVVIDQDGAMRLAVVAEFPESKHRLCMWHIMQKMSAKIVSRIYDDTDFKDKFGKIVLNMFIGPEEFEDRWNKLMEEFDLVNHKWLSKMYRLRSSWVPAFFVDSPLCGLMRTTSSLFIRVQKEIVAGSWLCSITGMSSDEGCTVCTIDEEKIKPVGLPEVIDKESTSENVEEEINLNQKVTRHYKKNEAIEKLAMEASIILDSCVHMAEFDQLFNPATLSDFVQEFMGLKKPDKVKVKNPTGVRPKGREKQKRIKSGREISMKKIVVPGGSDHVVGGLRDGTSGSVSV
ncbi:FAR1-related sequence 5-like protein, partial [Tanacetum coccineum]